MTLDVQATGLHLSETAFPDLNKALSSGWFDAFLPDLESPQGCFMGHDVWRHVAAHRRDQGQPAEAELILLKGLPAGFPDGGEYEDPVSSYLNNAIYQSKTLTPSNKANVTFILVLYACILRYRTQSLSHQLKHMLTYMPAYAAKLRQTSGR